MMWIPAKAAFRAGVVNNDPPGGVDGSNFWNDASVGLYSVALGRNALALGESSLSIGNRNEARAVASGAIGIGNKVLSGFGGMALGTGNELQDSNLARNGGSFALGWFNRIDGTTSAALGRGNKINENYAIAIGIGNELTKGNTVAIGNLTFPQHLGAVVIGDRSFDPFVNADITAARGSVTSRSWGENTMTMRFSGGYRFYTSRDNASFYVWIPANANGPVTISDVRKKENFRPVNGEEMLNKIGRFRLTTWNYKGQDSRQYRHYGPMAQDFFAAFGNDGRGVIGTDTTIASTDLAGINFTAIQALVKRTEELRQKDQQLEQKTREMEALLEKLEAQRSENEKLKTQLSNQQAEDEKLKADMTEQQNETKALRDDLQRIKEHLGLELKADRNDRETNRK
jgi:regulator of replication initiation timing